MEVTPETNDRPQEEQTTLLAAQTNNTEQHEERNDEESEVVEKWWNGVRDGVVPDANGIHNIPRCKWESTVVPDVDGNPQRAFDSCFIVAVI